MGIEMRLNAVVLVAVAALGATALGQRPPVRGSLDAMTVVPPTQDGSATGVARGHPMLPGQGDMGAGGMGMMMGGATSGAIRVNVTQGTKDGPALGRSGDVQLFSKGVALKTYRRRWMTRASWSFMICLWRRRFSDHYGDARRGGAAVRGPPVTKMQPMVEMDMAVYETTAEKPAWTIGLRDIDVVAVDLAHGDRVAVHGVVGGIQSDGWAWTGELVNGQRRTMTLPLAADARTCSLGRGLRSGGDGGGARGGAGEDDAARRDAICVGYTIAPRAGR